MNAFDGEDDMKTGTGIKRAAALMVLALIVTALLAPLALADHRWKGEGGHRDLVGRLSHGGGHHGNEATGEAAAWLLGIANFPVVLSLLLKGGRRFLPDASPWRARLASLNRAQKKVLMWLHYLLNPAAVVTAFIHFALSRCRDTVLPEIGLMILIGVVATGLVLKFKLISSSVLKTTFRVHTHPLLVTAVLLVLLIGHTMMD